MKADFEPAASAAPKDGDFARYVEELVNRGHPVPGTVREVATFDAAGLLKRLSGRTGSGGQHRGIPPGGNAGPGVPAHPSADTLPDLPVLIARGARAVARLASRLLLAIAVLWLVLGLIGNIPFLADTVPIAMGLLFLSLYLRPGKPKPPKT